MQAPGKPELDQNPMKGPKIGKSANRLNQASKSATVVLCPIFTVNSSLGLGKGSYFQRKTVFSQINQKFRYCDGLRRVDFGAKAGMRSEVAYEKNLSAFVFLAESSLTWRNGSPARCRFGRAVPLHEKKSLA